jgi:Uma2 family endonuclease
MVTSMSTDDAIPLGEQRRFTRSEYERLVAQGWFEDEPIELLDGVLVTMSPQSDEHAWVCAHLGQLLAERLVPAGGSGRYGIQQHSPFAATDDSEPEPDIAVIPARAFGAGLPTRAHLLVEVAVSSLRRDRGRKRRIYARNGTPEYWIVDVEGGGVEVHTEPDPATGVYRAVSRVERGGTLRPVELPGVAIDVLEILPRAER